MRSGETVFQAVGAAGIFGNVAADAAHGLRGRVRRVEVFVRLHAPGDIQIDDAGFDSYARVGEIDIQDAIHAREADAYAVFDGQRTATEACAGAASNEGDAFAMADAH